MIFVYVKPFSQMFDKARFLLEGLLVAFLVNLCDLEHNYSKKQIVFLIVAFSAFSTGKIVDVNS